MSIAKKALKAILPHGVVVAYQERMARRGSEAAASALDQFHRERKRRTASVERQPPAPTLAGDDYEQVVSFLVGRGLADTAVRWGSMPAASLEFIRQKAIVPLDSSRPRLALHIGNFLGVSLAFLTAALKRRHNDSLVVSIDPNLTHRGVSSPQSHVLALLAACGLQQNAMVLAGYSGRKSISNDGAVFDGYDPVSHFAKEAACEETLRNLSRLCPKLFDLVITDGNHDAAYLVEEIRAILPLLRNGAYLVLDDVDESWAEIRDVFLRISSLGLTPIADDGRVGIARSWC